MYEMGVCEESDCQVLFTLVGTSCGHQPVDSAAVGPDSGRDAGQVRMSSLDYDLQYFRLNFEQLCAFCV